MNPTLELVVRGDWEGLERELEEGEDESSHDFSSRECEKRTILELAAVLGKSEAVKMLIKAGAPPNQVSASGNAQSLCRRCALYHHPSPSLPSSFLPPSSLSPSLPIFSSLPPPPPPPFLLPSSPPYLTPSFSFIHPPPSLPPSPLPSPPFLPYWNRLRCSTPGQCMGACGLCEGAGIGWCGSPTTHRTRGDSPAAGTAIWS